MRTLPTHFLTDDTSLHGEDAAAAIIVSEDGRYLLQLRDDMAGIFYPGHWGCFGGAISPGETPLQALTRELSEELRFDAAGPHEFVQFDFDFTKLGQSKKIRAYYEYSIKAEQVDDFVLGEGADMRLFSAQDLFNLDNVTPYDSFAIWLHAARHRFGPARTA